MNVSSSNVLVFFFYKRKTPYELRISDWSSDVCSSDLTSDGGAGRSSNRETAAAASITWMRLLQWRLPAVACSALRRRKSRPGPYSPEIGRAHVCTPVTNAHLVCRLLLAKKKTTTK